MATEYSIRAEVQDSQHVFLGDRLSLAHDDIPGETHTTGLNLVSGKQYWLVVAVFKTGSSFGDDPEPMFDVIDVYEDRDLAMTVARAIKDDDYSRWATPKTVRGHKDRYPLGDGSMLETGYFPWRGYFERLLYVEVKGVEFSELHFDSKVF